VYSVSIRLAFNPFSIVFSCALDGQHFVHGCRYPVPESRAHVAHFRSGMTIWLGMAQGAGSYLLVWQALAIINRHSCNRCPYIPVHNPVGQVRAHRSNWARLAQLLGTPCQRCRSLFSQPSRIAIDTGAQLERMNGSSRGIRPKVTNRGCTGIIA
jgi:hypothetical protein